MDDIKNSKLKLVFTDGIVKVYENQLALPRAFFVSDTLLVNSKQESIDALFNLNNSLGKTAVVENSGNFSKNNWSIGEVSTVNYSNDSVILKTDNKGNGFLVLTDSYYPTWHAKIDGKETQIFLTDYNFRGIVIPEGKHTVEFYDTLF